MRNCVSFGFFSPMVSPENLGSLFQVTGFFLLTPGLRYIICGPLVRLSYLRESHGNSNLTALCSCYDETRDVL